MNCPLSDTAFHKMPALFIGHGSPMNALESNGFSKSWQRLGRILPKPRAILCISAHWQTSEPAITGMAKPRTIHDFAGFPAELSALRYPAPGDPELARAIASRSTLPKIYCDDTWGLDHGSWSILRHLYPDADVPVLQLSLALQQSPAWHFAFARTLSYWRDQGILIIGSGNVVHNLAALSFEHAALPWGEAFASAIRMRMEKNKTDELLNYQALGEIARLSVPTPEHFLPLIYIVALRSQSDQLSFFNDALCLGSISMQSFCLADFPVTMD